ncbi:MAG TPA: hypothetical protein VGO47_13210 [Chlamydiales bacterium]|nr:hypothetical protein [Chlamydiales bacterium]
MSSARQSDTDIVRNIVRARATCILPNHRNTLTNRFINNNIRATARAKRADHRDEVAEKLGDLGKQLELAKEERDIAARKINGLRAEKKQISGSKNRRLRTNGRGKRTPAIAVSKVDTTRGDDKENDPFLIGTSTAVPSSALALEAELELPPSLPLRSHGHHGWGPTSFPPSTCPPGFHLSDFSTSDAPLASQHSYLYNSLL